MKKTQTFLPIVVILVIHLSILILLQFTAWPEMTFWPYLINKGWMPYRDIAIAHTPLLIILLSIIYKLFGVGILQLKIFTWILILATDILFFWVVQKLWNRKTANLAILIYILLQVFYEGNGLWFELALTPVVIMLFFFIKTKKWLWAGVLWGVALLIKQTAAWYIFPIIFSILNYKDFIWKIGKKFSVGLVLVGLILLITLIIFKLLPSFWFWAVKFGVFYLPVASGQLQLPTFRQFIIYLFPFTPIFFAPDILLWIIAGSAGIYPRWGLFHFQAAIPFLAIGLSTLFFKYRKKFAYLLLIYSLLVGILIARQYIRDFRKQTRFYDPEVKKVVQLITENQSPNTNLYVLNYWDNIYAYSRTLPVIKPWFPYLSWYLDMNGVRDEILADIKINMPPEIVVAVDPPFNWRAMDDILKYYSCFGIDLKVEICRKND